MRYYVLLLIVLSCQSFADKSTINHAISGYERTIEVFGFGQFEVKAPNYNLTVIISQQGTSAIKTSQSVEHKLALIENFVENNAKDIKFNSSGPIELKVIYPLQNNAIEQIDVFSRLPNKLPAKINTKVNKVQNLTVNTNVSANQRILVTVTDVIAYQRFLDYLFKIGVNEILANELSMLAHQQLYQQALDNALSDAKVKANKIAKSLGVSVTNVVSVQEIIADNQAEKSLAFDSENLHVNNKQNGRRILNAQVKVIFAIKPQ